MDNLNIYNKEWISNFKSREVFKKISSDFDLVVDSWYFHDDQNYYFNSQQRTPREVIGSPLPTFFSIVPFYYIDYLTSKSPSAIYDIGCGWNIFKKYISVPIIGIDRENPPPYFHADIVGKFTDSGNLITDNGKLCNLESIMSINSIHFISITMLKDRFIHYFNILRKNGRGFVAFNVIRLLEFTPADSLLGIWGHDKNILLLEMYIRNEFDKIQKELDIVFLVFDLDLSRLDDGHNGNLRIVFDRI